MNAKENSVIKGDETFECPWKNEQRSLFIFIYAGTQYSMYSLASFKTPTIAFHKYDMHNTLAHFKNIKIP